MSKRLQCFFHFTGQRNEIGHTELLGAARHDVLFEECRRRLLLTEELFDTHAQHLPPLSEDGLDNPLEETLVAVEMIHAVARHADDGTLDLRWRIEDILVNLEEILHIIISLDKDTQDAIGLRPGRGGDALCHLPLDHSRATGDEILVLQHLKEDLGGDIIGIITREHKRLPLKDLREIHLQEVGADDILMGDVEVLMQPLHTLGVDLHDTHAAAFLTEILRQHTHARPYFQDGDIRTGINGVGDALGYRQIGQEMLTEILLWCNEFH